MQSAPRILRTYLRGLFPSRCERLSAAIGSRLSSLTLGRVGSGTLLVSIGMAPWLFRNSLALLWLLAGGAYAATADGVDYFERNVRPLLARECYACHSGQAPVQQADLRVDSLDALLAGGKSGPAIVPGDAERSLLVKVLRHETEVRMPPGGRLTDAEVDHVAAWIRMGAPYQGPVPVGASGASSGRHWAFVLPTVEEPPPSATGWALNGIDRFVEARLVRAGLEPSPEAAPRSLIRRVYYDLTGLPPDPDDSDAFIESPTPEAYEAVVDSLLASKHFGERWARHWLDVARYADAGYFSRPFPAAWTYRDWVVDALNDNLPYDEFVTYQLAADLVGAETRHLAALGFLTLGINLPRAIDLPDNLDDRIDVATRGLLGLSVACARCHDHKFDQITQEDYYALYGVFLNSPDVLDPVALEPVGRDERAPFFREKLAMRREWLDRYRTERLADHVREFRRPEVLARYLEAGWESRASSSTEAESLSKERNLNLYMLNRWRAYLSALVGPSVDAFRPLDSPGGAERVAQRMAEADGAHRWPDPEREALRLAMRGNSSPTDIPFEDFWWVQNEGDGNVMKALKWQFEAVLHEWTHRGGPRHASVVSDAKALQPSFVFVRGNQHDKGREVPRRFLSALAGGSVFHSGSGRLELARAIATADNPLTARVMVNRVWGHLFGAGLVATPSDFGTRGERPTHPKLLNHLAKEFADDGWSVKDLIKRIVLSRTYRQSSSTSPRGVAEDPGNRLLWRQNRLRLDFEALRDSILAVAGKLDPTIGGAPFDLKATPGSARRTLYAYVSREVPSQLMRSFDFSNPEEHSPRRQLTTVPQQSLFLMNSPFLSGQARSVAAGCRETADCVSRVHRAALGRAPNARELTEAMEFVSVRGEVRDSSAEAPVANPWLHGTAAIDLATGAVSDFRPMGVRVDDRLQPEATLPARSTGRASLTAVGGFPGDGPESAVVRRWQAPRAMTVAISGKLSHAMGDQARRFDFSNGVRGWIVCGRRGALARWIVRGYEVETAISAVDIEQGEHLDFVVDSLGDYESDSFSWSPRIEEVLGPDERAAGMEPSAWSSKDAFVVPDEQPLSPLEQYAQVLLMTNEFAFRD